MTGQRGNGNGAFPPKINFWGSKSYATGNDTGFERQFGVIDSYHVGDDLRKIGYTYGGFILGKAAVRSNKRPVHDFFDILIVTAVSGMWKSAGMYYTRHIDKF